MSMLRRLLTLLSDPLPPAYFHGDIVRITGGIYYGMQGRVRDRMGGILQDEYLLSAEIWALDWIKEGDMELVEAGELRKAYEASRGTLKDATTGYEPPTGGRD